MNQSEVSELSHLSEDKLGITGGTGLTGLIQTGELLFLKYRVLNSLTAGFCISLNHTQPKTGASPEKITD